MASTRNCPNCYNGKINGKFCSQCNGTGRVVDDSEWAGKGFKNKKK